MANRKERVRESNTGRGQGKMFHGHVPTAHFLQLGPTPALECGIVNPCRASFYIRSEVWNCLQKHHHRHPEVPR